MINEQIAADHTVELFNNKAWTIDTHKNLGGSQMCPASEHKQGSKSIRFYFLYKNKFTGIN